MSDASTTTEERPSRQARKTANAAPDTTREAPRKRVPEVPRSAFNFIAVQWEQRRARRRSALVVGGVVGSALLLVLSLGYRAGGAANALKRQQSTAQQEIAAVKQQVAAVFGPNGADVVEHMKKRRSQIDGVLAFDLDIELVQSNIVTAIDPSVRVMSLQLTPDANSIAPPETTPPSSAPDGQTTTPTPDAAAPVTTVPTQLGIRYLLNLSMMATSYDDLPRLEGALRAVPFLSDVALTYGGSPASGLKVDVTAKLDPTVMQPRRTQLFQELQGF